jgi:two-component sensor histidine kinase
VKWAQAKGLEEYVGDSFLYIGELYYMEGNIDSAIYYFKSTIDHIKIEKASLGMTFMRLGECFLIQNKLDSTSKYYQLGSDIILQSKELDRYTMLYTYLGALANKQERFVTAIEMYTKALEYADQAMIPMRLSNVHSNIAAIYSNIGDINKAKDHVEKSIQIASEHGYQTTIRDGKKKLAIHENALHNYENAILLFEEIIPYFEQRNETQKLVDCYVNCAFSYLKQGNLDKCKEYLNTATRLVTSSNEGRFSSNFHSVKGHLQKESGRYREAEKSLLNAKKIAVANDNTREEINVLKELMTIASISNQIEKDLLFTKEYHLKKDSLFSLAQSKIIYDHEARYKKAEQDLAIANLNSENQMKSDELAERKTQLYVVSFGILLLAVLFIFFYRLYRKVKEQNAKISKADQEKAILLKEIHHRVKNNLQVVSSLLGLQSRFVDDEAALEAIKTGRSRVQSMSILHQNLYRNENLKSIKIKKYFEDLGQNLFDTYKLNERNISFDADIDNFELDIDVVVPMGLITNELVSNALKHAFTSQDAGRISLSIKKDNDLISLTVADNGKGIQSTTLPERSNSLGLQLIKSFSEKLNAKIDISNTEGTTFKISFKPEQLINAAA